MLTWILECWASDYQKKRFIVFLHRVEKLEAFTRYMYRMIQAVYKVLEKQRCFLHDVRKTRAKSLIFYYYISVKKSTV